MKVKPSVLVAFFLGLSAGVGFYPFVDPSATPVSMEQHQIQDNARLSEGRASRSQEQISPSGTKSSINQASVQAYFSPRGGCTQSIVNAIHKAKSSIYVMAYGFTSKPIAIALMEAHGRGVEVKILMDRSQLKAKHSQLPVFLQKGMTVFIDPAPGIAHNKVMIFDEEQVLTGSFNFSHGAETKNAENILFIQDAALAHIYKQNWENRAKKAMEF